MNNFVESFLLEINNIELTFLADNNVKKEHGKFDHKY